MYIFLFICFKIRYFFYNLSFGRKLISELFAITLENSKNCKQFKLFMSHTLEQ